MAPKAPKQPPIHVTVMAPAAPIPPDKMKPADLLTAWEADPEDEALTAEVSSRTRGQYVANPDNSVAIAETVDLIALVKRGAQVSSMWGDKPIRKVADRASGSNPKVRFNPYRPANAFTPSGFDPALNVTFPIADMATMIKHSYVAMALDKVGAVLTEDDIADIAEEVQGARTPRRSVKRALAEMALAEADDDPDGKIAAAKRRLTNGAERPFARDDRSAQPATVTPATAAFVTEFAAAASGVPGDSDMRSVRATLARLYQRPADVSRLCSDINVSSSRLDLTGSPETMWFNALGEVQKHGKMAALLAVVRAEYPAAFAEPADAYDRLCRLLPAQFDEVIFRLGVPEHILPSSTEAQGVRAMALVRWAAANRVDLNATINRMSR